MFLKAFAIGVPLVLGGMYVTGALGGGQWTRDVARSQNEVAAALADLDVSKEPGAPGTDPSRSGGVPSVFRLSQTPGQMRWTVMSGDRVATTMIADLVPIDATHTRVTAHVERGDAPDDFVAPAFRSKGVTLGLFSMALEGELNHLVTPAGRSAEDCAQLFENLMRDNFPERQHDPGTLSGAMGQTAVAVMKLGQIQAEARRQGCEPRGFDAAPVQETMRSSSAADDRPATFKPGEPMLDPTPAGDRR